jgi:[ribosomal protein S5]-alanine N-acetyltransferase
MRRVSFQSVQNADEREFVAAARASRRLHHPWVKVPSDAKAFRGCVSRMQGPQNYGFLLRERSFDALVGAVEISNVVRGIFRSGYLGYYVFIGFERQGLMREGLLCVIRHAFKSLELHRLEANIQPANVASIALVRSCGFQKEGLSPRYLKIGGRWRDHERWAILAS